MEQRQRPEENQDHDVPAREPMNEDVYPVAERFPNLDRDEEAGAELVPELPQTEGGSRNRLTAVDEDKEFTESEESDMGGRTMSWIGLAVSVLAFFMFPIVLGAVGALLGFFGYRQGAGNIGIWAMGLGALAIVGSLLLTPFMLG